MKSIDALRAFLRSEAGLGDGDVDRLIAAVAAEFGLGMFGEGVDVSMEDFDEIVAMLTRHRKEIFAWLSKHGFVPRKRNRCYVHMSCSLQPPRPHDAEPPHNGFMSIAAGCMC